MKWKWRLIWFSGLLLLWLLCSGVALAAGVDPPSLASRVAAFPEWQGKPPLQPVGKQDLIYPDWFAGDWAVTTTLVDLVAPLAPDLVTPGFESNRQFLNQPIQFQVRFVEQPAGGLSFRKPAQQFVSDRAYNGTQLAKAYLGDRAVLAVKVDPANPNRQITLLKGDRQLVSTVTGRATESTDSDQFITSEFFQQEFRGTPQLYFNEVENTTIYRHLQVEATVETKAEAVPDQPLDVLPPEILADQITAIYLSPQDADYFKTLASDNLLSEPRPVALYRYRMAFRRLPED
jgi:hypothetical protein